MRWGFKIDTFNQAGAAILSNLPVADPIGWADIVFTLKRDKQWHGVFFEYSVPLSFYDKKNSVENTLGDPSSIVNCIAYSTLKTHYQTFGVDAKAHLQVYQQCNDTDDFELIGTWRFNFETYEEDLGDICLITMNLEPENYLMTFKNRYDQKVNIAGLSSFDGDALTPYAEINTFHDLAPKTIVKVSDINNHWGTFPNYELAEIDTVGSGGGTVTHDVVAYFPIGFNEILIDEILTRNDLTTQGYDDLADVPDLFTVEDAGDYTIEIYGIDPTDEATMNATLSIITDAVNDVCGIPNRYDEEFSVDVYLDINHGGTVVNLFNQSDFTFCDQTKTAGIHFNHNATYTFAAGDQIQLYVRIYGKGLFDRDLLVSNDINWNSVLTMFHLHFTMTALTLGKQSQSKMSLINETASRVAEAITNDGLRVLSDYYGRTDSEPYNAPSGVDGCGSLRSVALGLHIRNNDPPFHALSFKDIFENLKAIDNIGIGLENDNTRLGYQVIRMEPMEYFYGLDVLLQLDKVPSVKRTLLRDEIYSIFKNGYEKWEAEEFTGLDEFATKREYRTRIQSTRNELSQVASWIASGYAIELTRERPYSGATKEDWRYDNDTFIICLVRDGSDFKVEQGNITGPTFLIDPATVYNFRISPARNALKWMKTVMNCYPDPLDTVNAKMEFTSGDGNVLAAGVIIDACSDNAWIIAENQSLSADDVVDPGRATHPYKPELWEFEYPLSFTDYNLIKANPTGIIQMRYGQQADFFDFYIREIVYKPNEGIASWKLLPRGLYPVDDCCTVTMPFISAGGSVFGSSIIIDSPIENVFVFVNGHLQKYNEAVADENEIESFDLGFITLKSPVPAGTSVNILRMPVNCDGAPSPYSDRVSGTDIVIPEVIGKTFAELFIFYAGAFQKWNESDPDENEIDVAASDLVTTGTIVFKSPLLITHELRILIV